MNLLVLVVFLLVPATFVYFVWMIHTWRRREALARQGRCLHCGYDLRASQGRCPECGTPIPQPEEAEDDTFPTWIPITRIKPRIPRADEHMICAFTTTNVIAAGVVCERLQAAGMICLIEGENTVADAHAPERRLMVWSEDAGRAAEVITALQRRNADARSR